MLQKDPVFPLCYLDFPAKKVEESVARIYPAQSLRLLKQQAVSQRCRYLMQNTVCKAACCTGRCIGLAPTRSRGWPDSDLLCDLDRLTSPLCAFAPSILLYLASLFMVSALCAACLLEPSTDDTCRGWTPLIILTFSSQFLHNSSQQNAGAFPQLPVKPGKSKYGHCHHPWTQTAWHKNPANCCHFIANNHCCHLSEGLLEPRTSAARCC